MNAPTATGASLEAQATAIGEPAVLRFLTYEARLIDEWRFEEWLSLWAEDARYWVPAGADDIDPQTHVSLIYDDLKRLDERIYRLSNAGAHSQEPRSRTTHYLSGVEVDLSSPAVRVQAAMLVVEVRGDRQEIYGGRVKYVLRVTGEGEHGIRLVEKTVMLTRRNTPLGNLTFLL